MKEKIETKEKTNKNFKKTKKKIDIVGNLLILIGILILVFPIASDYRLYLLQEKQLNQLEKNINEAAKKTEDNESVVNVAKEENEFLGGLYIPSLELKTPIYYGTAPQSIENGVGLMETTDRLGQGKGHHTGLTSHSGLSISRLFTDLPKIKKGDQFYIKTVDGEVLAYEVKDLETVLPTKLDVMIPEKDKDLVTLVTCVPLFINTHRLLVKGERIEYKGEMLKTATPFLLQHKTYILVVVCSILFIIILVRMIELTLKKRSNDKRNVQIDFME